MTAQGRARGARIPFRASDCFVLALDDFMRRTGQGRHISQSVLELDAPPDLERLRAGLARIVAKHPILVARPRRDWTGRPYWDVPAETPDGGLPLALWREEGAPGLLAGAAPTPADAARLLQDILTEPLPRGDVHFNARFDLAERRDGRCLAALSWSHLLLDGKGAELLLAELGRLCEGIDLPDDSAPAATAPALTWREKFRKALPAHRRFNELQKIGLPSLGGPKPRAGRGFYEVVTLDEEESAAVRARCEAMAGGLFPVAFYVACVARAQDRVFLDRGREPRGYAISMPAQTRKRGARGPLFHNHVTALYFNPLREHLGSLEETTTAMKRQFAEMNRSKINESFDILMGLMMRVPSRLFMGMVRSQFDGEICTCFHSHTGVFAPELQTFAGARVTNAYHLACLGSPPGTGIFFGEHGGRINISISWREGALSDEERAAMIGQLRADLIGCTSAPVAAAAIAAA
jgi:hypothetical protein